MFRFGWTRSLSLFALMACPSGGMAQADASRLLRSCLDSCTLAMDSGSYGDALRHINTAWREALALQDSMAMPDVLVRRSEIHQMKGDFYAALIDLYDALRLYERRNDEDGLADVYNRIGAVHHYDRNYAEAGRFYRQSLTIRERQGRAEELALIYGNIGSLLEDMGRPDSALSFHRKNLRIRRGIGEPSWVGVSLANMGSCYDRMGIPDSARHYLEAGLGVLRGDASRSLLSQTLVFLGEARLHAGSPAEALTHCTEALRIAEEIHALPTQESCYDCLYQAHQRLHHESEALHMLELLTAARDSMFGRERAKGLLRIELNYAFERQQLADSLERLEQQHQADIAYQQRLARERDQKRVYLFSGIGVLLLAGGLWNRLRFVRRSRNLIQQERDRSEELLLNILPGPIAEELKRHGRAQAREVDGVSILFTDIHDFTRMSERMGAQELVSEIDTCFRAFDAIVKRRGLEKIKTIGDAYMCVGGLPQPRAGSARETVLAALEMQQWLKGYASAREARGQPGYLMRAGIHTGPVVAGIVGDSKFQYDVWGDTVNIAARMESAGTVGEVNISEATFELVRMEPELSFSPRGRLHAKGKGELAMFFVRRSREVA